MKPNILIFADFPNWAYYEIQQFVKNNLNSEFNIYCDFLIYNLKTKSKNPLKRLRLLIDKHKYQTVNKNNNYDLIVYLGYYFDELMINNWQSKRIVKGIYTEGFPPKNSDFSGSIKQFTERYLACDAIVCGSKKIQEMYVKTGIPSYYANSVIDSELFKRSNIKKINLKNKFIIGWTGNPKRDFKGYYSHILPAIEIAKKKYPDIEFKSRFSGSIETLPNFYCNLDLIIIASDADAGPSLFAEAGLMEVPAISTDVGWPSEIIKQYENGIIVERTIDSIANQIINLYENRQLVYNMSKQIRSDIIGVFDKKDTVNKWRNMFNEVLSYE